LKRGIRRVCEESLMNIAMFDRVKYLGREIVEEKIKSGDIGYVIEIYDDGSFEVEFSNLDGTTRGTIVLAEHEIEVAKA
jgi:hypothetical protein